MSRSAGLAKWSILLRKVVIISQKGHAVASLREDKVTSWNEAVVLSNPNIGRHVEACEFQSHLFQIRKGQIGNAQNEWKDYAYMYFWKANRVNVRAPFGPCLATYRHLVLSSIDSEFSPT